MLCKLWKYWYSYVGLCKDGPEHVGRVVTVVESYPIMSHPSHSGKKGCVCLEVWWCLSASYCEVGTGLSCPVVLWAVRESHYWKTAYVKFGALNFSPFHATTLHTSQNCHILRHQISCTEHPRRSAFKQKYSFSFNYTMMSDVVRFPNWVCTQAGQP